jgi:hypothetical protein
MRLNRIDGEIIDEKVYKLYNRWRILTIVIGTLVIIVGGYFFIRSFYSTPTKKSILDSGKVATEENVTDERDVGKKEMDIDKQAVSIFLGTYLKVNQQELDYYTQSMQTNATPELAEIVTWGITGTPPEGEISPAIERNKKQYEIHTKINTMLTDGYPTITTETISINEISKNKYEAKIRINFEYPNGNQKTENWLFEAKTTDDYRVSEFELIGEK